MTIHQQKQIEIINKIEKQIQTNSLTATAVIPVQNFDEDNRMCLTSVHFPHKSFIDTIYSAISIPLQKLFPEAYYYDPSSLHLTIKNIRVINNPPTFAEKDVEIARAVFNSIIPRHKKFKIYPYRLLLFKNNLALMSTTDEELDGIILDLNQALTKAGIPDDKQYVNPRYFFSNMTIARFISCPPPEFIEEVHNISSSLSIAPYIVDSVDLITSNAVMKKRQIQGSWVLTD
jgi:2'-5' RNA ligase